jgi:hypothetical protein
MFELHVVVAGIVMFNIIELIMEIMPNYPKKKIRETNHDYKRNKELAPMQKNHDHGNFRRQNKSRLHEKQNFSLRNKSQLQEITKI